MPCIVNLPMAGEAASTSLTVQGSAQMGIHVVDPSC